MKLFVFDLDFTLWNAGDTWCDCTAPPYFWEDSKLLDQHRNWLRLYNDVAEILQSLQKDGKKLAVASRTNAPIQARELLRLFKIDGFFVAKEIYPGDKIKHLNRILQQTNCKPFETVFFDDEYRNIRDVQTMGVESVFVEDGLNWELVRRYW